MTRASSVTVTPVLADASSDLATLREQRRALAEQIKQVKAAHRAANARRVNLASDIVRRLSKRVRTRINAGMAQDEALDQVFSAYRAAVAQALASAPVEMDTASEQRDA